LSWSMTLTQRCSRSSIVMPSSVIGDDLMHQRSPPDRGRRLKPEPAASGSSTGTEARTA
jgi:hypothetical protein